MASLCGLFLCVVVGNFITCSDILHCICKGNIVFHWCECMVGRSTLRLMFDWVGSVNGTTSNRVARLHETENMCRYQQEGIDPPSGEKPANYGQT